MGLWLNLLYDGAAYERSGYLKSVRSFGGRSNYVVYPRVAAANRYRIYYGGSARISFRVNVSYRTTQIGDSRYIRVCSNLGGFSVYRLTDIRYRSFFPSGDGRPLIPLTHYGMMIRVASRWQFNPKLPFSTLPLLFLTLPGED